MTKSSVDDHIDILKRYLVNDKEITSIIERQAVVVNSFIGKRCDYYESFDFNIKPCSGVVYGFYGQSVMLHHPDDKNIARFIDDKGTRPVGDELYAKDNSDYAYWFYLIVSGRLQEV